MSRIVVSGATGFVGKSLSRALVEKGHEVVALTRDPARAGGALPSGVRAERWDPGTDSKTVPGVDGAYAVVHLAGEPAVGQRWSERVKREIMDSRVKSAELLVNAIERASVRPKVLVSSSGVGYYGPHGDEALHEKAPAGADYLARVTIAWEGAAVRAEALGVRVVRTRFGIIFGKNGGALVEMVKPFKLFVGGPIGSGKQIVSWIHLDDAVSALMLCLEDQTISGAVNVVSPNAVPNEELAQRIGAILKRPSAIAVPEVALRIRFGEGADPLITGQRAIPAVLQAKGFSWRYPEMKAALEDALG
jgi:uncharacterized protein (TIGR01777 family)